MRLWAFSQRKDAIASLNKDKLFWLYTHHLNEKFREAGEPPSQVPNLEVLKKSEPGKYPDLESRLHKCVIDFLIFLKYPTSHKQHWERRQTYLPWLIKDYHLFLVIWEQCIHTLQSKSYGKSAKYSKDFAWRIYLDTVFQSYEKAVDELNVWPNFPACEAEDTCMLCAIQFQGTDNITKPTKCDCCEMKDPEEEKLIPELSTFGPLTPNGSRDESHNKHLLSLTASTTGLQSCLEPEKL